MMRSRRDFLSTIGVSGAAAALGPFVPFLNSRAEAQPGATPVRLLMLFTPNGSVPAKFWPTGGETDFTFPAGQITEPLAMSLNLSMQDARLLAFLWRGMSNEEVASTLNVRVGTVKSRLFRLYQKLGVKKRATAVLRAAEVLRGVNPQQ